MFVAIIEVISPLTPVTASAAASEPESVIVTKTGVVNPLPGLTTLIAVITPRLLITATAEAPVPSPAEGSPEEGS